MAINISIASDVTDVIRGTKNIAEALEEVADELETLDRKDLDGLTDSIEDADDKLGDLGKAGDRAADQLEDSIDGAKDSLRDLSKAAGDSGEQVEDGLASAGKGADRLEDRMRAAFKGAADQAESSGKRIGDSQRDGLNRAGEGLDEFKNEANSTAREAAASFDGSASSIADGFQEVAANALAGFGPLGAAAGLALAAGLGIAMAALNGEAERVNEIGEEVAALAQEIRDTGGSLDGVDFEDRMVDWGLSIQDTKEWFEIFQKEAKTGLEVIEERARAAGVGWESAFKGTKGTLQDSRRALEEVDAMLLQVGQNAEVVGDLYSGAMSIDNGSKKQLEALEELKRGYEDNIVTLESAERQNQLLAEAGIQTAESQERAAETAERNRESVERQSEAMERSVEVMDRAKAAQDALADAAIGVVESEIRTIDAFNAASESIATNGLTLDLNTEQGRNNAGAVLEVVKSLSDQAQAEVNAGTSVTDATAKMQNQRNVLVDQLLPAFNGNRDAAAAYIDQMLKTPKAVTTDVNLDGIPDAQQQLNAFTSQRPTISVGAQLATSRQDAYNQLNGAYGQHSFAVNAYPRGGAPALP